MQKSKSRICFIVNPIAGRRRSVKHIATLNREVNKRWPDAEIVMTVNSHSASELAREKSTKFEIVVACGGDGTVSQVVNGLVGSDAALGVVPIGSGNDFVKSLHLNRSIPECLDILKEGFTTRIDLIRFEGDEDGWCANTIGMGLDGLANYFAVQSKMLKGFLLYAVGALKACLTFRGAQMRLTVDDRQYDDHYLMLTLCNGKWEGGQFYVAPDAEMNDGWLNLLMIKKLPLYLILTYLPRFRSGPKKTMKGVHSLRCKKLTLQSESPIYVHSDGEHISGSVKQLKLSVVEKALKVVVARQKADGRGLK